MVFAIHQHELATGIHVSHPTLNPPLTSLPTLSLWVVPEHQLWEPCFMHRTCPGHLPNTTIYWKEIFLEGVFAVDSKVMVQWKKMN